MSPLRSRVRTMALLCLLLGPIMIAMSAIGFIAQKLIARAEEMGVMPAVPPGILDKAALDFSVRASWVSIPLGLVLLVSGALALKDTRKGRPILARAAWISAAAMIGLAVMWSFAVEDAAMGFAGHATGWVTHGLQAVLAVVTARWLARDDVRAACDEGA